METQLGQAAIYKEATRYAYALDSQNPLEINATIRELDSRINSFTAPEEALEGPASAKDAALVTIRRTLRDSLNDAYPQTKPINKQLSDAIEVRSTLKKQLGQVAFEPDAANAQYSQQYPRAKRNFSANSLWTLRTTLTPESLRTFDRNKAIAGGASLVAGGAGIIPGGKSSSRKNYQVI